MGHTRIVVIILLAMSAIRVAPGSESVVQQDSVGKMGVARLLELMQMTVNDCSAEAPGLAADFESQMARLRPRIQSLGTGLLLSEEFKDLRDLPVPASLADRASKDLQTTRQLNAFRGGRPLVDKCTAQLKVLQEMDDVTLVKEVANSLWIMRVMLKDTEQRSVR
jgi:hypothetical protein